MRPAVAPAGLARSSRSASAQVAGADGFNWGYDPLHYTTPEGSYATDPDGPARTLQFREMVKGINRAGLRVIMDVVYNHTPAAGQDPKSVLDRIVPGYYQRLDPATGAVETSTCCSNTATEHLMMGKLLVDSVLTWATQYKVDGFRFDLMGHQPKALMVELRHELDALTRKRDGVDGRRIFLYGEGWNFGEVANNARFVQASQLNMAGTGIATFSDRLRDAVRGGGPFDADPGIQGFASGLYTDPNDSPANGTPAEQRARLLHYQDLIKLGLAANLRDYTFVDSAGQTVRGSQVDYNGQPAGYAADPGETITYVDAHDNETLFDALQLKLPRDTAMADRVRMNTIALATTALAQSPSFWHAGNDLLRSKSLDRNSYDSGDWFNRIDWSGRESTFGSGLPPAPDNKDKWPFMRPLLADPALKPGAADMRAAHARAEELLRIRFSSPLFRLGSAELIQDRVSFPIGGPGQTPGVIVMAIDDRRRRDHRPQARRRGRRLQRLRRADEPDRGVARRPPLRAAPGPGRGRRPDREGVALRRADRHLHGPGPHGGGVRREVASERICTCGARSQRSSRARRGSRPRVLEAEAARSLRRVAARCAPRHTAGGCARGPRPARPRPRRRAGSRCRRPRGTAGVAALQLERVAPAPGELEQAAAAAGLGRRDRAAGVEVAGAHVGAVDGRVGELLRGGPVEAAGVRARDDGLLAALGRDRDLERDVERPVLVRAQVRSGSGSCSRAATRCGSSASSGTIQGEIEVANDLPRNGPSGTYSQRWMSRALQSLTSTKPKTCSRTAAVAMLVPSALPGPVTKPSSSSMSSRSVGPKRGAPPASAAAAGPGGGALRARDDHRARAAVVADRQVAPVRQQRLGVRSEHLAEVRGVLDRGVEVHVVADRQRQHAARPRERHERGRPRLLVRGRPSRSSPAIAGAGRAPGLAAEREERVQHRPGEHAGRQVAEQPGLRERLEDQRVGADPHRRAGGAAAARPAPNGRFARPKPDSSAPATRSAPPSRRESNNKADVAGRRAAQRELERGRVGDLQLDGDVTAPARRGR